MQEKTGHVEHELRVEIICARSQTTAIMESR